MKANEAPERLYLSETIYSTYLYQVPDPDDETAVEYTRTDAFIEKAAKWLDDLVLSDYVDIKETSNGTFVTFEQDKLVKDFRNYMKGE